MRPFLLFVFAFFLYQQRPISSGIQSFPDLPEDSIVGKPIPHLAAAMQVSGEAQYVDDIPTQSGEVLCVSASENATPFVFVNVFVLYGCFECVYVCVLCVFVCTCVFVGMCV